MLYYLFPINYYLSTKTIPMPELPEVQTTVNGINAKAKGKKIVDVWTDYRSISHIGKDNIKDKVFFDSFKKKVVGSKITEATRRAKNILIHLSSGSKIYFPYIICPVIFI